MWKPREQRHTPPEAAPIEAVHFTQSSLPDTHPGYLNLCPSGVEAGRIIFVLPELILRRRRPA